MSKILYEKYDVETGAYLYEAEFFEEGAQPIGYTSISKGNFIKAFLDIENQVAYEGATQEEIEQLGIKNQIDKEFIAYEQRRKDGINAYNQINAEFRVLKINEVIDQTYYDSISEVLQPVIFQIITGQWVSGLQKLEMLGSSQIGTQLYDRLHLQISNYITNNY